MILCETIFSEVIFYKLKLDMLSRRFRLIILIRESFQERCDCVGLNR